MGIPIRYNGVHDEVELEDGQTVKRHHEITVDDDLARRLLEQADNYSRVKPKAKPRAKAEPAAAPTTTAKATPAAAPDVTPED